jgi:hypothetical protein
MEDGNMSGLVLLSLPLSLTVIAVVAVYAIVDAIRHLPVYAATCGASPQALTDPATELMQTMCQIAGQKHEAGHGFKCPESPFVPQVTEIEAKVIAGEIRLRGNAEVNRVIERSRSRSEVCPMRQQNGWCACSAARPLDCVGRCFAGADSPEWVSGLGETVASAFHQHLQSHHASASTQRLDDALLTILDSP